MRALRAQRAEWLPADRCTATIAANADLGAYLLEKAWADRLPGAVVKTPGRLEVLANTTGVLPAAAGKRRPLRIASGPCAWT